MNDQETRLHAVARAALDESVDRLDGATLSRLSQARAAAVASLSGPETVKWLPVPVMASVLAAFIGLLLWNSQPEPVVDVASVADLEFIAASEPLDLYDDLEFFMWLSEQDIGSS